YARRPATVDCPLSLAAALPLYGPLGQIGEAAAAAASLAVAAHCGKANRPLADKRNDKMDMLPGRTSRFAFNCTGIRYAQTTQVQSQDSAGRLAGGYRRLRAFYPRSEEH